MIFDFALGVVLLAAAVAIATALIVDGLAKLARWRMRLTNQTESSTE